MSISPEIRAFIQKTIRQELLFILFGTSGANTVIRESIENPGFPGSNTIENKLIMHPFGFVSRAPLGILNILGRQGADPGSLIVLGHMDPNRPEVDQGDTAIYSTEGPMLGTFSDGVYVGDGEATKPLALGEATNDFLKDLMQLLVAHVHPGPGAPANNSADMLQLSNEVLEANLLISTKDGGLG